MWLLTTFGAFSVVQKSGNQDLTVRARVRGDLDRLRESYLPKLGPTVVGAGTDYRYRAEVPHDDFARALAKIGRGIHYSNFKHEAERVLGSKRGAVYAEVWRSLAKLKELDEPRSRTAAGSAAGERSVRSRPATNSSSWRQAHGGVVFDNDGRVLLFKPRNEFDGYVWTFPKGRPRRRESPETAAVREVREETGVEAAIVAAIPGEFAGHTTETTYYLMLLIRDTKQLGPEAEATQWVTPGEAPSLIALTRSVTGRRRDLAVLKAALAMLRKRDVPPA